MWVVDVCPVVTCVSLTLVDQNSMQPVRHLKHSIKYKMNSFWGHFWDGEKTIGDLKKLLTCIMDLSEYISSMVLWILDILACRSDTDQAETCKFTKPKATGNRNQVVCSLSTCLHARALVPLVSFSTSLLQRCRQPSSTRSSSSVMCRGAGCMGRSGGTRDWVNGLWIETLCCCCCCCCWACIPEQEPSGETDASGWSPVLKSKQKTL